MPLSDCTYKMICARFYPYELFTIRLNAWMHYLERHLEFYLYTSSEQTHEYFLVWLLGLCCACAASNLYFENRLQFCHRCFDMCANRVKNCCNRKTMVAHWRHASSTPIDRNEQSPEHVNCIQLLFVYRECRE